MKIYKVGGAVRDSIMGVQSSDNDWVVVGSSPEEMISKGYKPIGKDFPVFLHEEIQESLYQLACNPLKSSPQEMIQLQPNHYLKIELP